jgi:DNA primase
MVGLPVIDTLTRLFKNKPTIQKGGEEVLVFCPNCKHHKKKLNINTQTGYYQCWVCSFSGKSFYSLLKKVKAPIEYYEILCKDGPKRHDLVKVDKTRLELPQEFHPLYKPSTDPAYKNALSYLFKRNISVHDVVRYNIGYCPSGNFANRIIVPSYDADAQLNFYCGRDFCDGFLKYRLCDGSKDMIGFELFTDFNHELTLVEGVFDAMSVKYNVVPLFGKTLSKKLRIKLIENRPPRVNVLLDNDALTSSLKICDFLIQNGINTHLVLLDGKDPNELGHNITWQSIRNSVKINESILYRYKLTNKL